MKEYKRLDPRIYEVIGRNSGGVHSGYLLEERETMKRFMFKEINPWPPIAAAFIAKRLGFTTPEMEAAKPWWKFGSKILPNGETEESRGTLESWVWETLSWTQLMYHWDPEIKNRFLAATTDRPEPLSFEKAKKNWRLLKYVVADPDENTGNLLVKYKYGEVVDWVAIDMERAFSYNPAYKCVLDEKGHFSWVEDIKSSLGFHLSRPPYNLKTYQKLQLLLKDQVFTTEYLSGYLESLLIQQIFERVAYLLEVIEVHISQLGSERVFRWEGLK